LFVAPDVPLPGTFLPFWHGFLVGALAYWAIRQTRLVAAFWLFAATIATIAIATGNAFSLTCAVTVVVLSVAATTGSLYTGLNWRWLQFLGLISYSLYLLHNPVTGASFRVGYMLTGHSVALELMWWAVSIGACVAAAGAAWWCIERPSIKLARKIRLSTANVAESAAAPAISRKPAVTVEP
jgi:peptidoglycan/LPS O-acetylase OafA/YrhL